MKREGELRILFVEDLPEDAEMAAYELKKAGFEFRHERVDTKEEFLEAFPRLNPDVVISDYSMPRFDGMKALTLARGMNHAVPFIVLTGSKNEETAVLCLKSGASDYVIKSHMGRLPFAVREALEHARVLAERETAIAALRESEESYRTLADSGQALIWTSGADRLRTYVNKTWLEFTGRTLRQELGDGWTQGVHPDDLPACVDTYLLAFERREKFGMEYRLRRNDGEYRWIQDVGSPRYDSNGAFTGYIGHCLDITERRLAEDRTRKALEDKETLLRELFHRTRNNMQVIMAILSFEADVAKSELVDKVVRETNERIMSMSLVHRKLYESQDLSRIDLKEYTEDLLALLMQDCAFAPGRVCVNTAIEPVSVLIDTAMPFALILNELVTNAFRHAFPGGRAGTVSIGIRKTLKDAVELSVSDDGVGLPERFDWRASNTMGLQLVHGLVEEQMKGSIRMESSRGVSCFVSFSEADIIKRV